MKKIRSLRLVAKKPEEKKAIRPSNENKRLARRSTLKRDEQSMVRLIDALSSLNKSLRSLNTSMSGKAERIRSRVKTLNDTIHVRFSDYDSEDELSEQLRAQLMFALETVNDTDLIEKEKRAISYGWVSNKTH